MLEEPATGLSTNALKVQMSAAGRILELQAKLDDSRLKRRKLDLLPKLLERISEEERSMAARDAAIALAASA